MANTLTTMTTLLKYVTEKGLNDLKPNSSIVYDMAPMKDADMIGRKYLAPVALSHELGFTFGDGGAFSYNDDVAAVYDEIEVDSNPVVLKTRISIEAADRLAKTEKSMLSMVALRAGQLKTSLLKMAEIEMLHGRVGVGVISGNPAVNTTPTPDQGTIIFTDASWAPGVWAGMEGAQLDCYNGSTKVNANGALTLVSVDFDAKTIVVSGDNTDLTDLADGYSIFFRGAYANGQYGLKYQLDTAGSVFGVDSSAYALWKAQEHTVSGALTMEQILKGRAKAVARGGLDEDCVLLVSSLTFENLNADMAALRVLDSSFKPEKGEAGHSGLVFHAQGGKIEIIAHPMMKEGEAFMLPKTGIKRIGSTDITFKGAGDADAAWMMLEAAHAYQLTARYSFQILISQPAKCVLFKSIVNS